MASGEPLFSARGLCFGYGRERVLEDVDLDIEPRDFLAIIGPNGGGKTTLLKILLGLLSPQAGAVTRRLSAARGAMGYVPQQAGFDWSFPISAFEAVLMGTLGRCRPPRRYTPACRSAASEALARLRLDALREVPVTRLSGGQIQRVLIARALAGDPEILFLDEPSSGVDAETREGLSEILVDLNRRIPIVLVTHDLTGLPEAVKNIACMNRRLYRHRGRELSPEALEQVYGCHIDLIAHGLPHRVLRSHRDGDAPGD